MLSSLFPSEEVDTFIDAIGSRSNAGRVRKLPAWMCDKGTVHSEDGNSLERSCLEDKTFKYADFCDFNLLTSVADGSAYTICT